MDEYYIPDKEYSKEYRRQCWEMATGLQAVDGLVPSKYLYELAKDNIEGNYTNEEIEELLHRKYENETEKEKRSRQKEADLVSNRIVRLLSDEAFSFSPVMLKYIHRSLFQDIYSYAGTFRNYNISKDEPILNGISVKYANYQMIEETLSYDFREEERTKYASLDTKQILEKVAAFTSSIWQVHPFGEGNTRTTAVFMECYLKTRGFCVDNSMFKENAQYFRNALVRANFADYQNRIDSDMVFLIRFYENLLFEKKNELRNRDTVLKQLF